MRLRKVVLSYPSSSSDFKFNLSLNYRISGVIHTYSDQKPSLVVGGENVCEVHSDDVHLSPQFCATRKGTQQAAATLVKDTRFVMNTEHKRRFVDRHIPHHDHHKDVSLLYRTGCTHLLHH